MEDDSGTNGAPPTGLRRLMGPRFTIRTAGAFFLLSVPFELTFVTSAVPLFGDVRGGAVAVGWHLFYAALFAAMGIGLWSPKTWGFPMMLAGTIFYTLDKARYLLDTKARAAELAQLIQGYEAIFEMVNMEMLEPVTWLAYGLIVTCWWGFVLYLYSHRDYFRKQPEK